MTLVGTGELVAQARRERSAVLAFNVITLEHAEAIVAGAQRAQRPVVLQISHNAVRHHGALEPIAAGVGALAAAADMPLAPHLDHVEDLDLLHGSSGVPDDQLRAAVDAGFAKVNIGTALNVAFTGAVRGVLASSESVDPRPYLRAGRDAVTAAVERLLTTLVPTPAGRPRPPR